MNDSKAHKNILICCDGTGSEYGRNRTNVVRLFEAVARDRRQIAFYDPGVGTFSGRKNPIVKYFTIKIDQAFGRGLLQNLAEAYTFLMNHYRPGDRVFLFGFSRGAFTVRALAGMLRKCGLMRRGYDNLMPYAIEKIYLAGALESGHRVRGDGLAEEFREAFSRRCTPYFIGVWDTVKSLGWLRDRKFRDGRLDPAVNYAYQAVAVDEKRRKFQVALWDEVATQGSQQVREQVWFPGVHSDVGGWYEERDLSDVALQWMLEKAVAAGLRLRPDWRQEDELRPCPRGVLHESRTGFWRLWSPLQRRIPEEALIHRSVLERYDGCFSEGYDPPLPRQFEIVEWGAPLAGAPAEPELRETAPGELSYVDSEPLDLTPYRHLLERGTTGIEVGARRVWRQVRDLLLRPLGRGEDHSGSFLQAVPPETVRQLASRGVIIDVPAGTLITRKGCDEHEIFVVVEGEFEADDDGRSLGRIERGEVFGEMAFFHSDGRRIASVRSCRDSRVLVLRRQSVEELLDADPTVATLLLRRLGGIMADRLAGHPSGSPVLP